MLAGTWLVFLPLLIVLPMKIWQDGRATAELLPPSVGFVFALLILYRTTANFLQRRRDMRKSQTAN